MYWDLLSSPQIDALDRSIPVVLPVAATEQHGPHLPLATDRLIGEFFCRQLDARIGDAVLILPSMSVGCSEHHLQFAGSLSLTHESFKTQAIDILDCVYGHGFKNLVIFNSHGGNQGVGQVILEKFGYRHRDCQLAILTWWRMIAPELLPLNESGPGGVGHACEFETSLMLHIAPDMVQVDKVTAPQNTATYSWAEWDMLRGARGGLYRTMKEMTANGVYGDPRNASAAKGEKIAALVVDKGVRIINDLKR